MKGNIFSPSQPSPGQGKKAVLTLQDMYAAHLCNRLMGMNFKGVLAGDIAKAAFQDPNLRHDLMKKSAKFLLVKHKFKNDGNISDYEYFSKSEDLSQRTGEIFQDWEAIQIVDLDRIRKEVNHALEKIG